jgi:cytochrome c553
MVPLMMRSGSRLVCALVTLLTYSTLATPLSAAEPSPQQLAFFESKIRPVLVEHCYSCHSKDAENKNKLKGGLLLDTKAGTLTGGDSGPSLVAGKPAESLLLKTLKYDGDLRMPPKGKLPDSVIADFETWIQSGAADPREGTQQKKQIGMSLEAGRQFWAYKPLTNPTPPTVKNAAWVKNPIDAFILHKLESAKATPTNDAEPHVWLRRIYFDLIGLPPTPKQLDDFHAAFAKNPTTARETIVDELLASPRFGERWGRHWLDVTRYAESVTLRGFILNQTWRYRDYVIESFNTDVPYDRFIREQLAGDLLPSANTDERTRNLVATTYLAMGNTNLEEQDKKQLRMDYVDEQLDVISKGFLAQTVTCARCHDHKFDPIPTKDYYALAGILRNTKALETANVSKWIEVPLPMDATREAEFMGTEKAIATLQAPRK